MKQSTHCSQMNGVSCVAMWHNAWTFAEILNISHQCKYICTAQVFLTSIVNFVLFGGLFIKSFYLGGGVIGPVGVGVGFYMYFNWVGGINVKWAMV